jgi:hypothetical protein
MESSSLRAGKVKWTYVASAAVTKKMRTPSGVAAREATSNIMLVASAMAAQNPIERPYIR